MAGKARNVMCWCYNEWMTFKSRKKAMDFFFEGMLACDGSEKERYTDIYCQLKAGKNYATDGVYRNKADEADVEARCGRM